MNPEVARLALQFLERTTMRPAERQAFDTVWSALLAQANPPPAPVELTGGTD